MLKNENDILLNKSMSLSEYINRIRNIINQNNNQNIESEDERIIKAAHEILKAKPKNIESFLNKFEEKIQKWINDAIPKEAILTLEDYDNYFNYAISNKNPNQEFVDRIINELNENLSKMSDKELEEYFKKMGFILHEEPQNQLKKEYPKR